MASATNFQNPSWFLSGPHTASIRDHPLSDGDGIPTFTDPYGVLVRISYVGVCGSDVYPLNALIKLPKLSWIRYVGPLLEPRRHPNFRLPFLPHNPRPRSFGYHCRGRLKSRLWPKTRRPRRHRTRFPMSTMQILQTRKIQFMSWHEVRG